MKVISVTKNTSFFTIALILQKIISFSYFAILARNLIPEDLGKYYLAISFTTIFAIIIDLGLANVLTREVAKILNSKEIEKNKILNKKTKFLRTVLFIKIPLAVFSVLVVFLLSNILSYPELVKQLIYISLFSMVLDSFTLTFWSYIRGHHVLKYESFGVVLFQIITFSLGLIFLKMGLGLAYLMSVMAMASAVNFIFSSLLVKIKFKTSISPFYELKLLKYIIGLSIPFAMFAVLQRLYMYLDSVMLASLAGDKYVGLYQIAFKIIFALQFLPMAFMASLYPAFALYYKESKKQLGISFERAVKYLLIISMPISLGVFAIADKIILIFKPEYIEAVWPLRIVILSLVFIFINFPIGAILNACDRQKINTKNMAFVLFFSIVLNLFLIPRYQVIGASMTVLASNILMFILGFLVVPNIVMLRFSRFFLMFSKVFASSMLMLAIILFLREKINIFINIIISAIIYISALFTVRGFRKDDISSIAQSLWK